MNVSVRRSLLAFSFAFALDARLLCLLRPSGADSLAERCTHIATKSALPALPFRSPSFFYSPQSVAQRRVFGEAAAATPLHVSTLTLALYVASGLAPAVFEEKAPPPPRQLQTKAYWPMQLRVARVPAAKPALGDQVGLV